jgi:hypothetical protein
MAVKPTICWLPGAKRKDVSLAGLALPVLGLANVEVDDVSGLVAVGVVEEQG